MASRALLTLPPHEASFYGSVTFGSGGLRPGRYDALLDTRRVRVAWHNAPAYRRDWIGIWKAGDVDLYNDYLTFAYTGATVAGSTTITGLKPGRHVARLMMDDGDAELATTSFTVAAP